jgi:hypothetical protein
LVTAEHAKLPLIAPFLDPRNHRYTDGANFASAGAGALLETHQGFVCDLSHLLAMALLASIIFSEIDFPFPGDRPKNSTKFFQGLSKAA